MSVLHIPIVHTHDVSKQIPQEKTFPSGWKCYKTIGSYVSCAFIEIWSTWEVWRTLKKLELLSAAPQATLTHLSCSPNFPRTSYLNECTLTYEPIVKCQIWPAILFKFVKNCRMWTLMVFDIFDSFSLVQPIKLFELL